MTEQDRARYLSLFSKRQDIHPSKIDYHMSRLGRYCLEETRMHINGTTYHLICGEPKDHKHSHHDIEGGVWWKRKNFLHRFLSLVYTKFLSKTHP